MAYKKYSKEFHKNLPAPKYWLSQAKIYHALGADRDMWACLIIWDDWRTI